MFLFRGLLNILIYVLLSHLLTEAGMGNIDKKAKGG
jgi:hypothetical protein